MDIFRKFNEISQPFFQVHLHNLKLDRQTTNDRLNKLEDDVRAIKAFLNNSGNPFQQFTQFSTSSNSNLALNDQMKRSSMGINYNVINSSGEGYALDDSFSKRYPQQTPPKRHENEDDGSYDGSHVMQLEKDTFKLRRDLQDAIASKKQAETRILA